MYSTDPKQHSMQLKSYVGMPAMEVFKSKRSQSVRPRGGRRASCWPGSGVGEGEGAFEIWLDKRVLSFFSGIRRPAPVCHQSQPRPGSSSKAMLGNGIHTVPL